MINRNFVFSNNPSSTSSSSRSSNNPFQSSFSFGVSMNNLGGGRGPFGGMGTQANQGPNPFSSFTTRMTNSGQERTSDDDDTMVEEVD